eukprot:490528-Pyramimonas_sp.AAC.1
MLSNVLHLRVPGGERWYASHRLVRRENIPAHLMSDPGTNATTPLIPVLIPLRGYPVVTRDWFVTAGVRRESVATSASAMC